MSPRPTSLSYSVRVCLMYVRVVRLRTPLLFRFGCPLPPAQSNGPFRRQHTRDRQHRDRVRPLFVSTFALDCGKARRWTERRAFPLAGAGSRLFVLSLLGGFAVAACKNVGRFLYKFLGVLPCLYVRTCFSSRVWKFIWS